MIEPVFEPKLAVSRARTLSHYALFRKKSSPPKQTHVSKPFQDTLRTILCAQHTEIYTLMGHIWKM